LQIIQKLETRLFIATIQVSLKQSTEDLNSVNSFKNSVKTAIITKTNHLASKQIGFKFYQKVASKRVITRVKFNH